MVYFHGAHHVVNIFPFYSLFISNEMKCRKEKKERKEVAIPLITTASSLPYYHYMTNVFVFPSFSTKQNIGFDILCDYKARNLIGTFISENTDWVRF